MTKDKNIEYKRYNQRSYEELNRESPSLDLNVNGAEAIETAIRSPYLFYEEKLRELIKPGYQVLDLCCGNGIHSIAAAKCGGIVTATDIAENSLEIAAIRAKNAGISNMKFVVADAENLPFFDNSFDIVTCVGSISYVDLRIFTSEIKRVLKPGGFFVCLDSFDHNPIYRFNRFLHYLRGNRSFSTLQRMPNNKTVAFLREQFEEFDIYYFGIFSFLGFLGKMLPAERVKTIIDSLDKRFVVFRRYSFKILIVARKSTH
ncbi:MAG: class I SAM-dependent methyltransferase [Sediminibacterium sp.]